MVVSSVFRSLLLVSGVILTCVIVVLSRLCVSRALFGLWCGLVELNTLAMKCAILRVCLDVSWAWLCLLCNVVVRRMSSIAIVMRLVRLRLMIVSVMVR